MVKRLILAAAMLFIAGSAFAQSATERVAGAVFSEMERQVIREGLSQMGIDPDARVGDVVRGQDRDRDRDRDGDRDRPGKGDKDKKGKADKGKGKKGKDKKGRGGLPPGLAKRDQLPPGLAKRDQLPPGLAERDLPDDMSRRLPPPPSGTRRTMVGDTVMLIDTATNTILDIIRGAQGR